MSGKLATPEYSIAEIRQRDEAGEADTAAWMDRHQLLLYIDAITEAVERLDWIDDGVLFVDQSETPLTQNIDHALIRRGDVLALLRGTPQ